MSPEILDEFPVVASRNGWPEPEGSLVAVCSVRGGAGATTVAYLLARSAARAGEGPALVCDLGGVAAGLAEYAGVESPSTLPALANAVGGRDEPPEGAFAHGGDGLRVLARQPRFERPVDTADLVELLRQSRQAHRLTVVDCGVPGGSREEIVLAAATHVIWVLPATAAGARRARRLLGLFPVDPERAEVVVAREDPTVESRSQTEELGGIAAERCAPLVLMPHVPDLGTHGPEAGLEAAAISLDAIRGVLNR